MKHSAKAIIQVIQTQMCFMKMELTFIEYLLCASLYAEHSVCSVTNLKSISVNHMCYYPDFIGEAVET